MDEVSVRAVPIFQVDAFASHRFGGNPAAVVLLDAYPPDSAPGLAPDDGGRLDTFSDSKFVIATGVSILTLLLTTVFGPVQTFLKTASLDVR